MRNHLIRPKAIDGLCAVFAALVLLVAQRAQAQSQSSQAAKVDERPIALKLDKASLFDAMAEIRKRTGVSFLVDGIPAKPAQIVEASGTLSQVLDVVSQDFGYFWTRSKTGVILLRKSFSDPADTPQLNLLEWQHMAHDVKTILWGFPESFDPSQLFQFRKDFYSTLTAEQKRSLNGGQPKGAEEMQWTDAQLTQVHQLCMAARLSSPQRLWQNFDLLLAYLPTSYLEIESSNGDLALNLHVSGMTGDRASVMLYKATDEKRDSPTRAAEEVKK